MVYMFLAPQHSSFPPFPISRFPFPGRPYPATSNHTNAT
jgi:hypothetical protein